ncbi:MAG: hypothetical protein VX346_15050 [Planctomycetota bacterium]|nr:hypothetical protein [Planctomycetota bacterium]
MFGKFGRNMARRKAIKTYKDGIVHADARRFDKAIANYSTVVDMRQAPLDVRAMARLNRALVYSVQGDIPTARNELTIVIHDEAAPDSVKNSAREKLKRLEKRNSAD